MFDARRPYNDLPLLPPKESVQTPAILNRCISASRALAGLRFAGQLIPDQAVLVHTIPNLEARESTAIENIVTTKDALFREDSLGPSEETTPETKEAARYRAALYHGVEELKKRPLSTRIAVEVCQTIKGAALDVRSTPGTTLTHAYTGEVIYTPPEGEAQLRTLLTNWEQYLHESKDVDPLIRMAVLHYQFEAIHPFSDGNGRTGRILNVLCLIQAGLLDLPTLYLSRHILGTRSDYYRLLARITSHQEWEPWIIYMLTGVEVTSQWTTEKIKAIRALTDETIAYVRLAAPKMPRDVVDLIFTQPYCRISSIVDRGIAKRQTASGYLKELEALGILEEEKVGRDKIFLHRKYLDVLFSDDHTFAPYEHRAISKPVGPMTRRGRR
jgi:Fic family protein